MIDLIEMEEVQITIEKRDQFGACLQMPHAL